MLVKWEALSNITTKSFMSAEMIDIFCIGHPGIAGDSVGPLVGSLLSTYNLDVNIIGSIDDPVIVSTYRKQLSKIRKGAFVVVVDATVGEKIGTYEITNSPIIPGAALQHKLHAIGDLSIRCYTCKSISTILHVKQWESLLLAHKVTTRLVDLLTTNKIKGIYREYNIIS